MSAAGELSALLERGAVLAGEADVLAYSYDGALDRARPDAVVLARAGAEVSRVVRWCSERGTPFTARGAGTNLSGGCIPLKGGVILSTASMAGILEIDASRETAVVEPGVINLKLQRELEKIGFFHAPDPASYRVCTLGGNVAENAGGPRCLKYGVTSNHVLALEAVMPDGSTARFSIEDEGPDLVGLLTGSEGTLGVVTRAWLRILRAPETIRTVLAGFPSVASCVECVSEIVAAGIVPRVLEAMDRTTVESVEAYCRAGYPDTDAVLLIELDGPREQVRREAAAVEALCRGHGASEYREAADEASREKLWEGRRGAYAAVARIAPNVLVEDGVVPRGRLPEAHGRVQAIARDRGVRVAMLFHAGDGNLHPNIAFDERDESESRQVKAAGFEMLKACVELGGSISGEHGIGVDKRAAMSWLFSPEALRLFRRIKDAFDPRGVANPDKIIPLPGEAAPGAARPKPALGLSPAADKIVREVRSNAGRAFNVVGTGSKLPRAISSKFPPEAVLRTDNLNKVLEFDRSNYTARAEAGIAARDLKSTLGKGFYAPIPDFPGTLGGMIASKAWVGLRNHILGMRILLANGDVIDLGGKVMKNVAGYDAAKLLLGSWGSLAVILDVTLKLYPFPVETQRTLPALKPFVPNAWHRKAKEAFDPENRLNPWVFGQGAFD